MARQWDHWHTHAGTAGLRLYFCTHEQSVIMGEGEGRGAEKILIHSSRLRLITQLRMKMQPRGGVRFYYDLKQLALKNLTQVQLFRSGLSMY